MGENSKVPAWFTATDSTSVSSESLCTSHSSNSNPESGTVTLLSTSTFEPIVTVPESPGSVGSFRILPSARTAPPTENPASIPTGKIKPHNDFKNLIPHLRLINCQRTASDIECNLIYRLYHFGEGFCRFARQNTLHKGLCFGIFDKRI